MTTYWPLALVIAAVVVLAFLFLHSRIQSLEKDVEQEQKLRQDLRDEYREFYWDMHRAVAAMGLKKTPSEPAKWVKN